MFDQIANKRIKTLEAKLVDLERMEKLYCLPWDESTKLLKRELRE